MPSGLCFSSGVLFSRCVCAQWESRGSRAASRGRAEGDHHVLAATRRNGTCECLWRLCSIALTWNHVTKGGNHVSEPHEDYRRLQFDASPPGARRGVLCARRTKGTGLVRRIWVQRDYGFLHTADAYSGAVRFSCNRGRIFGQHWFATGSSRTCRGFWHRVQHGGGDLYGSSSHWIFCELVWSTEG